MERECGQKLYLYTEGREEGEGEDNGGRKNLAAGGAEAVRRRAEPGPRVRVRKSREGGR